MDSMHVAEELLAFGGMEGDEDDAQIKRAPQSAAAIINLQRAHTAREDEEEEEEEDGDASIASGGDDTLGGTRAAEGHSSSETRLQRLGSGGGSSGNASTDVEEASVGLDDDGGDSRHDAAVTTAVHPDTRGLLTSTSQALGSLSLISRGSCTPQPQPASPMVTAGAANAAADEGSSALQPAAPSQPTTNSNNADNASRDESTSAWRARDKHFLMLTTSGKPVWALHGDADALAGLMALTSAIVSVVQSQGDRPHHILGPRGALLVFLLKGPFILVARRAGPRTCSPSSSGSSNINHVNSAANPASCSFTPLLPPEPPEVLHHQLELIYRQVLLVVTSGAWHAFNAGGQTHRHSWLMRFAAPALALGGYIHAIAQDARAFIVIVACVCSSAA
jgi:hypothetical protein